MNDFGDISLDNVKIDKKIDVRKFKNGGIKNILTIAAMNKKLSKLSYKSATRGNFTLTLGGDHSVATGSIHGSKLAYSDLKILWIDAHADINTFKSSPSGNYHGMPLSPLLHLMKPNTIPGFSWLT